MGSRRSLDKVPAVTLSPPGLQTHVLWQAAPFTPLHRALKGQSSLQRKQPPARAETSWREQTQAPGALGMFLPAHPQASLDSQVPAARSEPQPLQLPPCGLLADPFVCGKLQSAWPSAQEYTGPRSCIFGHPLTCLPPS